MIDLYCERTSAELWGEPVNTATNVAFFVAAFAVWRFTGRSNLRAPDVSALWVLIALIGAGSGLFHAFAENWARLLDELPILAFQLVFIWAYVRRAVGVERLRAAVFVTGFLLLALGSRRFPEIWNGSLIYAPAVLVMLAFGVHHYRRAARERGLLIAASAVFACSVFFRTIDQAICPVFPLGTHFLWHLLNSAVLYMVARALIVNLADEYRLKETGSITV